MKQNLVLAPQILLVLSHANEAKQRQLCLTPPLLNPQPKDCTATPYLYEL